MEKITDFFMEVFLVLTWNTSFIFEEMSREFLFRLSIGFCEFGRRKVIQSVKQLAGLKCEKPGFKLQKNKLIFCEKFS